MSAIKGYNLSLKELERIKRDIDNFEEKLRQNRNLYTTALEETKEKKLDKTISFEEFLSHTIYVSNLKEQLEIEERIRKVSWNLEKIVGVYNFIREMKRTLLSSQLHNMGFEYAEGFSYDK